MRYIILNVCLFVITGCAAQSNLPVIKATSVKATITENGKYKTAWNLSPQVKPDVYTTGKLTKPTAVKLTTDTDSITLTLKPGQYKDFIVVLNGKDSCYTRFQAPAVKNYSTLKPSVRDTIPFTINKQNTIYIKAIVNSTDTLNLNFDSGTTGLVLTKQTLKTKIKSGIKLYDTPCTLKIGSRIYEPLVYDAELTGHDTDGRLGWNLFDGMVVELNYDKMILVVHSRLPAGIAKNKKYAKLDISYQSQLFFVEGMIRQNGIKNTNLFLFDTGYQRTVMLDNDLLNQNNFPASKMKVISKVMMHGATGNEIPVITAGLEALALGKHTLGNVPVQLLTTNKPLHNANVHILGNEVLKRFNTFIDFQVNAVYLMPNTFYGDGYVDGEG